jgi:hypothetical protein
MRDRFPRWRALIAALSLVPLLGIGIGIGPAAGQVIGVQSGEHPGFSRLVLDIGTDRDWTLSGSGRSRTLSLDPPVQGFALGTVFDLIPRTRLASLDNGVNLTLGLACECDVTAERYRDRYLILDIAPRPDPAPAATATAEVAPAPDALDRVARQAAAERLPDLTALLTRPGLPGDRAAGAIAPALPGPDATPRPGPVPPDGETRSVDMAEAARLMAEQLARAAASGLLEAAPARPLSDADPAPRPARNPVQRPAQTGGRGPDDAPPDMPPEPTLPLRAATALDLLSVPPQAPVPPGPALACAGSWLPVADWSAGRSLTDGIATLRRALVDDRDRLNPETALALARHYLFHGFGAEAAHWLGQLEPPPADLLRIAAIVDGDDAPRFPPEPDPLACTDEELLWRYLGGGFDGLVPTPDQADRLQRATAALPAILRDQIGPRMARQLQADGFPHHARNLRDMLRRGDRIAPAALLALDLDLGLMSAGQPGLADALDRGLRDDAADPTGAMAQALAFARDSAAPVDPDRLVAAEALLRETGIGPQTATLWSETLLAQARAGDLDRMLTLLASAGDVPPPTREAALTDLIADRVAAGDTGALLVLARVHGASWTAQGSTAGRARTAAIAHLRDAGLGEAAALLRAGQPALILPARPAPDPDPGQALHRAWVLGDWPLVAAGAALPHAAIARRLADPSAPPAPAAEGLPDLPQLAARLADSRDLRAEIAALLAAPDPRPVE